MLDFRGENERFVHAPLWQQPRVHQAVAAFPMDDGPVPQPLEEVVTIGGLEHLGQRVLRRALAESGGRGQQMQVVIAQHRHQAVLVPPSSLEGIDELREAGWEEVAFNLEVWNERLWPGIVPGKAATVSRERWLEALEYAVKVFGKGKVASVLIAGLEPKESHWAGVEWLAERGIHGVPIPWTPTPGSPLEGHQTPTAAWHLEVVTKSLDIWEKYGLDPFRHSSGGLHYSDLATMRRHLDDSQAAKPNLDLTEDTRYSLAVEGKLPDM